MTSPNQEVINLEGTPVGPPHSFPNVLPCWVCASALPAGRDRRGNLGVRRGAPWLTRRHPSGRAEHLPYASSRQLFLLSSLSFPICTTQGIHHMTSESALGSSSPRWQVFDFCPPLGIWASASSKWRLVSPSMDSIWSFNHTSLLHLVQQSPDALQSGQRPRREAGACRLARKTQSQEFHFQACVHGWTDDELGDGWCGSSTQAACTLGT